MTRETIDLVVLDTIADDCESLELIVDRLNGSHGWIHLNGGIPYTRSAVSASLLRLVQDGLAEALRGEVAGLVKLGLGVLPTGEMSDYWFAITGHGLMVHSAWEPPGLA